MSETPRTFLLIDTGMVLLLFYIYPIVPHSPAFLHSFLFLVTVVKSIGLKHNLHYYSLVLELFLSYSISYPIVPHAPAFLHSFLLLLTVVKSIGLKRQLYFYSLVLECFLSYSYLSDSTLRTSIST